MSNRNSSIRAYGKSNSHPPAREANLPLRILLLSTVFFLCFLTASYAAETEQYRRALSHYQKGEFDLSISVFEEAKKIEPRNALIYFYQGNAHYQINDLDNAIITFTAGLGYTDDKGKFFYNLGNCYYLKGNYQFSTEMYDKALAYDPSLYDSYLNAGNAYYKAGNIEKTILRWETYLEKYPETPQYKNIERAIAYLRGELQDTGETSQATGESEGSAEEGIDEDLLNEVMSDLDKLANNTENIMEVSEKPVDDLSIESIER
jgi:tetratricopeptide (TPR) repeat protein